MIVLMALAVTLAQETTSQGKPWQNDPVVSSSVAWSAQTLDGDRFWIKSDEMERAQWGVGLWMHGEHHLNQSVKYRSSLWRIQFFCNGTYQVVASSTFDAAGRQMSTWDGISPTTHVRPGTIYQEIEKQFCP